MTTAESTSCPAGETLVGVFSHDGQQHRDVIRFSSCANTHTVPQSPLCSGQEVLGHVSSGPPTSDVEAVVAGELGEGRHVVGVVGQDVGLLGDAARRLLDALVVGVLLFGKEPSEPPD